MASKDFALRATPAAVAVIERLRGTARRSYSAFETELRKQGCRVAGYRLLGAEDGGYSEYCCRRLVGDWRVITTFEPGIAIVVAVGRHDSRAFLCRAFEDARDRRGGAAGGEATLLREGRLAERRISTW